MRLPYVELEDKLNHVLKIAGDKLFKDLKTNNIISKQILS